MPTRGNKSGYGPVSRYSSPTRRAKMRKRISKVWGKIRKIVRNLRKRWEKWNSCPPGTVRLALATALATPFVDGVEQQGFVDFLHTDVITFRHHALRIPQNKAILANVVWNHKGFLFVAYCHLNPLMWYIQMCFKGRGMWLSVAFCSLQRSISNNFFSSTPILKLQHKSARHIFCFLLKPNINKKVYPCEINQIAALLVQHNRVTWKYGITRVDRSLKRQTLLRD